MNTHTQDINIMTILKKSSLKKFLKSQFCHDIHVHDYCLLISDLSCMCREAVAQWLTTCLLLGRSCDPAVTAGFITLTAKFDIINKFKWFCKGEFTIQPKCKSDIYMSNSLLRWFLCLSYCITLMRKLFRFHYHYFYCNECYCLDTFWEAAVTFLPSKECKVKINIKNKKLPHYNLYHYPYHIVITVLSCNYQYTNNIENIH